MAQTKSRDRLEVEIIGNSANDNWFRTAGSINPDMDRLIKDATVIHHLVLTHNGQTVAQIRNVRLRASQGHYTAKIKAQSSVEMPPIEYTDIDYEELDD